MKIYKLMAIAFVLMALLCNCSNDSDRAVSPAQAADPTDPAAPDPGVHSFTGLPLTEDGWTDFAALIQGDAAAAVQASYDDARVVFVSSSEGDDSTGQIYSTLNITFDENGMFQPQGPVNAFATLAEAYEQLRDGYPDILLLKRGDVWDESFDSWDKSGRAKAERMILGAYGLSHLDMPEIMMFRSSETVSFSHNIVTSIKIASLSPWVNAFSRRVGGENFLVEDCLVTKGANTGIIITGGSSGDIVKNVVVRRSVVAERYPTDNTGHTQGLFAAGADGFLVEECIFDHNGWTDNPEEGNPATIHNHNTYFDISVSNAVMRYNISARASSKGYQPGGGGLIVANLSLMDPIGIESSRVEPSAPDGFDSIIKNNVLLEGWDSKTSSVTRWGIRFNNVSSSLVEGNIIGSVTSGGGVQAMYFDVVTKNEVRLDLRNITLQDNIVHNWPIVRLEGEGIENAKIMDNRIHNENSEYLILWDATVAPEITSSGNSFYSGVIDTDEWLTNYQAGVGDTTSVVSQTNPTGGYLVTDYLASIGETATLDAFFARIQQQRRGHWDERYTAVPVINFVREKFGKEQIAKIY
ncbi:MAG: hypothetical protein C0613_10715 [Desulfobulbaceae bacterium]|nr:MAG: hypothetical protein C0613_10715 [Desulfobulbaceae bacterium]